MDGSKRVELSNALEILAPIVAPLEWLVLAASNLTGVRLFSELSFLLEAIQAISQMPQDLGTFVL
jgi:hypothetical protein